MKNSVAVLAIIASFVIGTIVTATPQVEAAGGWKEAFDQLLIQINVLDEKVQTLEQNSVNCQNEIAIKRVIRDYEFAPICEEVITLPSINLPNEINVQGTYFREGFDELVETPNETYDYQGRFFAECDISPLIMNSISDPDNLLDSPYPNHSLISFTHSGILTENDILVAPASIVSNEIYASELPTPIPSAEEAIGTFTTIFEVTITDVFGNSYSDTTTLSCSP